MNGKLSLGFDLIVQILKNISTLIEQLNQFISTQGIMSWLSTYQYATFCLELHIQLFVES